MPALRAVASAKWLPSKSLALLLGAATTTALATFLPVGSANAFTISSVAGSDGGSNFLTNSGGADINISNPPAAGDVFQYTFGPYVNISDANGVFTQAFIAVPSAYALEFNPVGNFIYNSQVSTTSWYYTLTSAITFDFDETPQVLTTPPFPLGTQFAAVDAKITLGVGTRFLIIDDAAENAVKVELADPDASDKTTVSVGGVVYEDIGGSFTWQQTKTSTISSWSGQVDVVSNGEQVPGPLPILGAASAFAYSRKIRQRISATRQSV